MLPSASAVLVFLFGFVLFGSLLAYRPESEAWYTGEPKDKQRPAKGHK